MSNVVCCRISCRHQGISSVSSVQEHLDEQKGRECRSGERGLCHLGQPVMNPGGVLVVGQAADRAVDVQQAAHARPLDHSATGF